MSGSRERAKVTAALSVIGGLVGGVPTDVRAVEGVIDAVGADVTPERGDDVLDATGMHVLPGLVNGHTHAAMTLFRGWGDDLPLMQWLEERVWPAEAQLTDDDVYWGTRLAIAEMLRTGTVRFWDMYWHGAAVARAVADARIRATVSTVVIDGGDAARGERMRSKVVDLLDELNTYEPWVTPSLGPHAVYTVSPETLTWIGELARERAVPVQIHCSETEDEVVRCRETHGVSPVQLLNRCGLLGPGTVLAHCVWVDDDDLATIAARGAVVVTNPVSNMKLGVGKAFAYADFRSHGIAVGLGTDGAASNNALDVLADAKFLSLLQKHTLADAAAMPASEAWAVATGARAPALGLPGHLVPGAPADFVLVPVDDPVLGPGDLIHNLVYAAGGNVVDTVVVHGHVSMTGGAVDGLDEIRTRAYACAARLGVGTSGERATDG